MSLNEVFTFLRKKGVRDAYQVLTKFKNYEADIHIFYDEFNKLSYYNAFIRVRDTLIERGLINIDKRKGKKFVILTRKGIIVYNKLVEIEEMVKEKKTIDS